MFCYVDIGFQVWVPEPQIGFLIEIGLKDEIQVFLCETMKHVRKIKYNTLILIKYGKIIFHLRGLWILLFSW